MTAAEDRTTDGRVVPATVPGSQRERQTTGLARRAASDAPSRTGRTAEPEGSPQKRTRVVLADVARVHAADGIRTDLTEQTRVGEALVRGLVRAQLALALRLSVVVAVGLGALPLLFRVAPGVGSAKLFGVSLPWLVLGVAAFPFLVAVGWAYVHLAQRNEQDFADLVRRRER